MKLLSANLMVLSFALFFGDMALAQTSSTSVSLFSPLRPIRTLWRALVNNFQPLQNQNNNIDEQPFHIAVSRPGVFERFRDMLGDIFRRRLLHIENPAESNRRQDSSVEGTPFWSRVQNGLRDRLVRDDDDDEFDAPPPGYREAFNNDFPSGGAELEEEGNGRQGFFQRLRHVFDSPLGGGGGGQGNRPGRRPSFGGDNGYFLRNDVQ